MEFRLAWARLVSIALIFVGSAAQQAHVCNEELTVRRLTPHHTLSEFRFNLTVPTEDPNHGFGFPNLLLELVSSNQVQKIFFVLTESLWRHEKYGPPPQPASPTGAVVSVTFEGDASTLEKRWISLIHSMNGAFGTSITHIFPDTVKAGFEFSAAAPRESLCVENYTPWLKMLPCQSNGLVNLIKPLYSLSSVYRSLGFTYEKRCEKERCWYEARLFAFTVYENADERVSAVVEAIEDYVTAPADRRCRVATASQIRVLLDSKLGSKGQDGAVEFNGKKVQDGVTVEVADPNIDISRNELFGVETTFGHKDKFSGRYIGVVRNRKSQSLRLTYTQVLPWWFSIYYHTATVSCGRLSGLELSKEKTIDVIKRFVPSIDRKRPAELELQFTIDGGSECQVNFDFEKKPLRLGEYPPDANHGLYVPAARIVIQDKTKTTVYSNILLAPLLVPDFSMPFNVICFVATAISFAFSTIHPSTTGSLLPVNGKLPEKKLWRTGLRLSLLVLLVGAGYMEYHSITLNALRREIVKFFERVA
ncbi:unnamed protein product, partial [Mesorhabditis spiculigera]